MLIRKMSTWAKYASKAVSLYHSWFPVHRGKHWLLRQASPFLIAPLGNGLWVRVTGVSGFEWKALRGQPGESATVALFLKMLTPGATVFDVGANVGYYALVAAKSVGPHGQVHAFEATPAVAERFGENVTLNRLTNVVVNHFAVCDRAGEVEFRLQADDSEGNSLVSYATDWLSVRVPAVTLDDYIADRKVGRVDILKVDVEGAEPLVFAGATALLSRREPPLLIVESNPATLRAAGNSPELLRTQLAAFGYRCYGVEQLTHGADPVWNILAVHPSHDRDGFVETLRAGALTPWVDF